MRKQRRQPRRFFSAAITCEHLEAREMLDASGAVAEAAGFNFFESREAFGEALIKQSLERNQYRFGQPAWPWFSGRAFAGIGGEISVATNEDTRSQVAGVAEADLFQSTDTHLFVADGNQLNVFDIQDAANPSAAASVMVEGNIAGMFLDGNTLTVVSSQEYYFLLSVAVPLTPSTSVTVFDVTDPANPELTSQTTLDGRYVESRSINGQVHIITSDQALLPGPRQTPIEDGGEAGSDDQVSFSASSGNDRALIPELQISVDYSGWWGGEPAYVYESRADYERWLRDNIESFIDEALPQYEVTLADGSSVTGPIAEATAISLVTDDFIDSIMTVTTIDPQMSEPGIVDSTSVFIEPDNTVYATQNNLYVAASDWSEPEQQTNILQFSWGTETSPMQLIATGTVRGQLLNQFAMDEYDGYLRVATSITRRGELSNFVYVLQASDTKLEQVGAIENFEQGERIYAVRFDGDRAFVVTFEQIDPLFIMDFSDPTNPTITGELEVPGFSNYLVRIDENYLLAIGRLGRDTKISVYDVSDTTAPQLIDEDLLPSGSYSIANWDYMAFGWYPELDLLAIPTSGYGRIGLSTFSVDVTASGEDVIHDFGFLATERNVIRSAYVGETLFAIGPTQVTATSVEQPHIQLGMAETAEQSLDISSIVPVAMLQTTRESAQAPMTVVLTEGSGSNSVTLDGRNLTITNDNGEQSFELGRNTQLVLKGSAGDDDISIDLSNAAPGIVKSFRVNAGLGNDIVELTSLPEGLRRAAIHVGDGADAVEVASTVGQKLLIYGGSGDDTLVGGAGSDVIQGGDGDDQLKGGDGDDRLVGRRGSDYIWGLNGNDTVLGGSSDDKLYGGRGNDLMRGGRGNDRMFGSNGADVMAGNAGDDQVFGNQGADTLLDVALATVNDYFEGGGGIDRFIRGNVPVEQVLDRLFDFTQEEDLISQLWQQ